MGNVTDLFKLDGRSWGVTYNKDADMVILDSRVTDGSSLSGSTYHNICYIPAGTLGDIDLSGHGAIKVIPLNVRAGYASTVHRWDYNWEDPNGDGSASYGVGMLEAVLVVENEKISDIEDITMSFNKEEFDNGFYNSASEFQSIAEYMSERLGKRNEK
jgi:hypothetical protein